MSLWRPDPFCVELEAVGERGSTELVRAFDSALAQGSPRRGTRVTCIVGGEAVRYRVIPWIGTAMKADERAAFVGHAFHRTFGDAARAWQPREGPQRFGQAALAAAVDETLLRGVAAAARDRGLRLVSAQPSLTWSFNAVRRQLPAGMSWFVHIESTRCTALLHANGEPIHLKVAPASRLDVAAMVDREWFTLGLDAAPCPVYVCRRRDSPLPTAGASDSSRWSVAPLDARSPHDVTSATPRDAVQAA